MTNGQPGFTCTVCALEIVLAHVPPAAPYCPSCGAATKPNALMAAQAGNVRCAHCDTIYGTFSARALRA